MLPALLLKNLKKQDSDDDDGIVSKGGAKTVVAGVKVTPLGGNPEARKHILVVGPGSGTGPGSFDKDAIETFKQLGLVYVALPTDEETGEMLRSETSENLVEMGKKLYQKLEDGSLDVSFSTLDLCVAGSRGGVVVATMLGEGAAMKSTTLLVKNGFEATPRRWLAAMKSPPTNPLIVMAGGHDYMNRDLDANVEFFNENWKGPVTVVYSEDWTHQMRTPAIVAHLALSPSKFKGTLVVQ